jgi:outer membrane lipoprotein
MSPMRTHLLFVVATAALLGGCATAIPEAIRTAPPTDVQLAEVRGEPQRFVGSTVRWGGTIASVRNLPQTTRIEVVGRRLDTDGRPLEEDQSAGRFVAEVEGFLDPTVFDKGREVTVRGRIESAVQERIGDHLYTYPLMRVEHLYLWAPRPPPVGPYPYYYDPFWYDPWYPWGWPYHPWRYPYPYHPRGWR